MASWLVTASSWVMGLSWVTASWLATASSWVMPTCKPCRVAHSSAVTILPLCIDRAAPTKEGALGSLCPFTHCDINRSPLSRTKRCQLHLLSLKRIQVHRHLCRRDQSLGPYECTRSLKVIRTRCLPSWRNDRFTRCLWLV